MGFTFPVYLISLILLVREVFCLRCYLCNSYDQQRRQGGWNETCNMLTPGKQLEQCPKLGTHCFTICTIDWRRNQRYIRRGCTSQKNLCTKFHNPVKKPGLQVECNVCSYDNCNHLNACEPEWEDQELDYATDTKSPEFRAPQGQTIKYQMETESSPTSDLPLYTTPDYDDVTSDIQTKESTLTTDHDESLTDYPGQMIADYLNLSDYNDTFTANFLLSWNPSSANGQKSSGLHFVVILVMRVWHW